MPRTAPRTEVRTPCSARSSARLRQPLDHDVLIGAAARGDDRVRGVEPVGRNLLMQLAQPVEVGSDG